VCKGRLYQAIAAIGTNVDKIKAWLTAHAAHGGGCKASKKWFFTQLRGRLRVF
jgi:NAD(P)H-nitrite reductase large subunit